MKNLDILKFYKNLLENYISPFIILRCVNKITYKLLFPFSVKIHFIFHIFLLKKFSLRHKH